MYLLHHSFTGMFSGVLEDPLERLLCIQQPSNVIHATARKALGQEVVEDQGDLVVLAYLWSPYDCSDAD